MKSLRKWILTLGIVVLAIAHSNQQILAAGVPVSLDVVNAHEFEANIMRPYMTDVRSRIQRNWFPQNLKELKVTYISMQILSDGTISALRISKSSGSFVYDSWARHAILYSNPLPPPPLSDDTAIEVIACFNNRFANESEIANNFRQYQRSRQPQLPDVDENSFNDSQPLNSNEPPSRSNVPMLEEEKVASHQPSQTEEFLFSEKRYPMFGNDSAPPTQKHLPFRVQNDQQVPLKVRQLSDLPTAEQDHFRAELENWFKLPPENRLNRLPSSAPRRNAGQKRKPK